VGVVGPLVLLAGVLPTAAADPDAPQPDLAASSPVAVLEDPVSTVEAEAGRDRVQRDYDRGAPSSFRRVQSTSELGVPFAVHLLVTRSAIHVDGEILVELQPSGGEGSAPKIPDALREGTLLPVLEDQLAQKCASQQMLGHLVGLGSGTACRLVASFDADTPFKWVIPVMLSAGMAGIANYSMVVENPWLKRAVVLHGSVPMIGSPTSQADVPRRDPLALSVGVDGGGLQLSYSGGVEGSPRVLSCLSGLSCTGMGDYDWPGLHRALVDIWSAHKALLPDEEPERQIVVAAGPDVPFEVIARVIDTARWDAMAPSPEQAKAEAADESSAAWLDWRSIRQLLLPYPVVASGG